MTEPAHLVAPRSMSKYALGYTRALAVVALLATTGYLGLVVIPDLRHASTNDLIDPTQAVPRLYAVAIVVASLRELMKPSKRPFVQHAIRGTLEGAVVAFAFVAVDYAQSDVQLRSDGEFHWAALYVALFMAGPVLSGTAVVAHFAYVIGGHLKQLRRRRAPT